MIKNLLILITFLTTSSLQAQTTYYVDATNGNDINNGTTIATAWQSLNKVNNQTFLPGDSILFKRGEIWRGNLNIQGSGNVTDWITYTSYGTGNNPQLLGSEQLTGWALHSGNVYKKSNLNLPSYAGDGLFEFDNYNADPIILEEDTAIPTSAGHWYYNEYESNGTIYLICIDSAAPSTHNMELCMYADVVNMDYLSYIEFSNFSVKFGNCKNIMIYGCDHINITNVNSSFQGFYGNPNIFIMAGAYVKIEDCVLYESNNSGIAFYPIGTIPGHHNTVRGCTISKMHSNDGITIHENSSGDPPGDYHLLENNIISECPEGSIDAAGGYHVFRNNICFNNGQDAFQVGGNEYPILIENNICYGNARNGLLSYGSSTGNSSRGNIIRNNVIYDNVKYCLMTGSKPVAIYNNTICNSATRSEVFFEHEPATTTTYKNNIIYNDNYNSQLRFGATGLPTDIEMDYNNYNIEASDSLVFRVAITSEYISLEQMQSIYNRGINSFLANPLFVDVVNKDFHLNANSSCIDAGDFLTKTTSTGSGTDIPVENVIYFCDGFGIVDGDFIQLEGQTAQVMITSIDTTTNIITVNQSISWGVGDGVALAYNGTSPDVGAYEYYSPVGGIFENNSINKMIIFPNPAKNEVYISEEYINNNYQIISLTGAVIKSGKINGNKIMLNGFNSGIYLIKIKEKESGKMKTFKLMKE